MDHIIAAQPRGFSLQASLRSMLLIALLGAGAVVTPLWLVFLAWCGWILAKSAVAVVLF